MGVKLMTKNAACQSFDDVIKNLQPTRMPFEEHRLFGSH
jgi:hypothetical protein